MNIGINPATVEAVGCDLARRNSMKPWQWDIPGMDASPKTIPAIILISGQRHTFTITAKYETFSNTRDAQEICAVGAIRYRDDDGVVRESGFFRVYNKSSGTFVASKNEEEEYQD